MTPMMLSSVDWNSSPLMLLRSGTASVAEAVATADETSTAAVASSGAPVRIGAMRLRPSSNGTHMTVRRLSPTMLSWPLKRSSCAASVRMRGSPLVTTSRTTVEL